jgi:hypothetical protein
MPPEYQEHESPLLVPSVLGALVNTMEPLSEAEVLAFASLPTTASLSLLALALLRLMAVSGRNGE